MNFARASRIWAHAAARQWSAGESRSSLPSTLWAAAEGKPGLKRERIKEIWNSEDYQQYHTEWERVAGELNSGISFKDLKMPPIPGIDSEEGFVFQAVNKIAAAVAKSTEENIEVQEVDEIDQQV